MDPLYLKTNQSTSSFGIRLQTLSNLPNQHFEMLALVSRHLVKWNHK